MISVLLILIAFAFIYFTAEKLNIIRERSLLKLSKMIPDHSCIIYFPHMITADGNCLVAQKMMYMNDTISAAVIDQIHVQLNKSTISQVCIGAQSNVLTDFLLADSPVQNY